MSYQTKGGTVHRMSWNGNPKKPAESECWGLEKVQLEELLLQVCGGQTAAWRKASPEMMVEHTTTPVAHASAVSPFKVERSVPAVHTQPEDRCTKARSFPSTMVRPH